MLPLNSLLGQGGFDPRSFASSGALDPRAPIASPVMGGGAAGSPGQPISDPRAPVGTPAPYQPIGPAANPVTDPRVGGGAAPVGIPARPVGFGSGGGVSYPMTANPFGLGGASMQPSSMQSPMQQPQNMMARPGAWNFFGQPNFSLSALGGGAY